MSIELQRAVNEYENFISAHGISEDVLNAYVQATKVALQTEKDREYGLKVSNRAKQIVNQFIFDKTGGTPWDLEKFSFEHKTYYDILNTYYDILLCEAQNQVFDSYLLYLERNREPKERFYAPKRPQFQKFGLIEAYQGTIDDIYDTVCVSMPPGTGKTTLLKFFNSAVIGWFPKDYNLFYSHSGDITRMYYDGVYQMVSDSDEYTWHDIFPELKVTGTNAKMQQFNVGKYKPFPSLQTASVGSENAGKVRASKFLLVDDMIGKLEEALNKNTLDKQWGAYTVDARQRKTMDSNDRPCKEIINATRWSVGDVIGRVIQMYQGNPRVKVVSMPATDNKGNSNFDYEYGGFTKEFFADQQLLMDDISYQCLFMQQPIEREGLLFPEDKIRRYLNLPHGEPKLITAQCDTKGKGTDFFVLPVLQNYGDDLYYCVDAVCDNTADYEMQYENAANILVNNKVQECEFERNAGGDRVAMEVNKRVESKGWICNITDVPTETNKEARIFQCSSWILQHIIFKDESLYTPKEPYGIMMSLLKQYSVSGKKQLDDVPDVFSNFALRMTKGNRVAKVEAVKNPLRGGYGYGDF